MVLNSDDPADRDGLIRKSAAGKALTAIGPAAWASAALKTYRDGVKSRKTHAFFLSAVLGPYVSERLTTIFYDEFCNALTSGDFPIQTKGNDRDHGR